MASPSSAEVHSSSGILGNSEQNIFTYHQPANSANSVTFPGLFFFWTGLSEGVFPRDYLISVANCLFACNLNSSNQQKRVWTVSTNNL